MLDDFYENMETDTYYKLYKRYFKDPSGDFMPKDVEVDEYLKDVTWGTNVQQFGARDEYEAQLIIKYFLVNGDRQLMPVPADHDCFYGAIRRGMNTPKEFTNEHLRRWIIANITKHHAFFYNLLRIPIAKSYGHPKYTADEIRAMKKKKQWTPRKQRDQEDPGPFTFTEWLRYVYANGSWGDDIMLLVWSLLTQTTATLVKEGDPFHEVRIRHNVNLDRVDFALYHCMQGTHFVGSGKFSVATFTIYQATPFFQVATSSSDLVNDYRSAPGYCTGLFQ